MTSAKAPAIWFLPCCHVPCVLVRHVCVMCLWLWLWLHCMVMCTWHTMFSFQTLFEFISMLSAALTTALAWQTTFYNSIRSAVHTYIIHSTSTQLSQYAPTVRTLQYCAFPDASTVPAIRTQTHHPIFWYPWLVRNICDETGKKKYWGVSKRILSKSFRLVLSISLFFVFCPFRPCPFRPSDKKANVHLLQGTSPKIQHLTKTKQTKTKITDNREEEWVRKRRRDWVGVGGIVKQ